MSSMSENSFFEGDFCVFGLFTAKIRHFRTQEKQPSLGVIHKLRKLWGGRDFRKKAYESLRSNLIEKVNFFQGRRRRKKSKKS